MTENELLAAYGLTRARCARMHTEANIGVHCAEPVVATFILPSGARASCCATHLADMARHAEVRGWTRLEPVQAAAA